MPKPKQYTINQLQDISQSIREDIIKMLLKAGSGHSAGSLGMADVLVALYFVILNHNPKNPKWSDRDRLVISNGHICPALYATLAHVGYFKKEELLTLREINSRLQGHPNKLDLPGLETSSGPLGQGLSQAVGMALSLKLDQSPSEVYCLTGDGELNEGQVWEAAMFAAHHKLDNFVTICDYNKLQIDGTTQEVLGLEPLTDKWRAFGWEVFETDGHNWEDIFETINKAKAVKGKPAMIIAHTVKAKGLPSIENTPGSHNIKVPDASAYQKIMDDLTGEKVELPY